MKTVLKPKTQWGSWREEAVVAQKRTHETMNTVYDAKDLCTPSTRPGADDHLQHPSRCGRLLSYKDGRQEYLGAPE